MQLFMESTSDCFWNWNMVSNVVERSIGFERAFGYSKEEIASDIEWWLDRLHPEDKKRVLKTFENACAAGSKNTGYEYRFKRKDGSYAIIEDHVCIIRDDNGNVVRSLGAMHDITKRKTMEAQLRQAQKIESLGTLSGGIAHEFNNLLTPILGFTELLIRGKADNDPDIDNLMQIKIAGETAKDLVKQLLAYGRRSLSQKERVNIETLIDDVIKLVRRTFPSSISIKKEIVAGLPSIYGMSNEIRQVILNLCINASHAMPNGGDLTIRLKWLSDDKNMHSKSQDHEIKFLDLSIVDTGVGIDEEILDRIFDPFFTTKEIGEGSGLGLSVVEGIVEQHDGFVEVENNPGGGSVFHVFLPVTEDVIKPSHEVKGSLLAGKERILLVDDESTIIELARSMLERLGYSVTSYLDSVEALNQFTENPQLFDVVLTDYGMPNLNGKDLTEKIKEIRPDIPVILFTGYGDLVAKENIHQWGMEGLIIKPFNLKELDDSITEVLKK